MKKTDLYNIGLTDRFKQEATMYENLYLARVSVQHKEKYKVIKEEGESLAELSGKFKYEAVGTESFPAVGDWVMVERINDSGGNAIIHNILRRKSAFERKTVETVSIGIDVIVTSSMSGEGYEATKSFKRN